MSLEEASRILGLERSAPMEEVVKVCSGNEGTQAVQNCKLLMARYLLKLAMLVT